MSKTYSWLNPDLRSRIFQNPICSVTAFQMVWDYYRQFVFTITPLFVRPFPAILPLEAEAGKFFCD